MAKKSKTQRAKASVARAQRKQTRSDLPRRVHAGERRTDDRLSDRDTAPQVDGRTHHPLRRVHEDTPANIGGYGIPAIPTHPTFVVATPPRIRKEQNLATEVLLFSV